MRSMFSGIHEYINEKKNFWSKKENNTVPLEEGNLREGELSREHQQVILNRKMQALQNEYTQLKKDIKKNIALKEDLKYQIGRLHKQLQDQIILEGRNWKAKRDRESLIQKNNMLLNQLIALRVQDRIKTSKEDEYKSLKRQNEALGSEILCGSFHIYEKERRICTYRRFANC